MLSRTYRLILETFLTLIFLGAVARCDSHSTTVLPQPGPGERIYSLTSTGEGGAQFDPASCGGIVRTGICETDVCTGDPCVPLQTEVVNDSVRFVARIGAYFEATHTCDGSRYGLAGTATAWTGGTLPQASDTPVPAIYECDFSPDEGDYGLPQPPMECWAEPCPADGPEPPEPEPSGSLPVQFERAGQAFVPCLYAGGAGGFLGAMEQTSDNIFSYIIPDATGLIDLNIYDCNGSGAWAPDNTGLRTDLGKFIVAGRELGCADAFDNSVGGAFFRILVTDDGSVAAPGEFDPNATPLEVCIDDGGTAMGNACDGPGEFNIGELIETASVASPIAPPSNFLINRWLQAECFSGDCNFEISRFGFAIEGESETWLSLVTTGFIRENAPLNNDCNVNPGVCSFNNLSADAYSTDPDSGNPTITLAVSENRYSAIFPGDLYQAPRFFIDAGVRHTFVACARITAGTGRIRIGIDYVEFTPPATFVFRGGVSGPWLNSTEFAPVLLK